MSAWTVEDLGETEVWTIELEARRNAISRAMLGELAELGDRAAGRRALRAVVITGAGDRAFSAGADLKERAAMSDEEVHAFHRELRAGLRQLEESPKVTIAAINGAALGGGLELALACDLRLCAPTAELGLPEVSLGIIPGGGACARLPRLIGLARAKELILTGRRVAAAEALALGLVSRIAAPGRLREEALALAGEVAKNAPISLRQAKRALDGGCHLPLEEALDLETRMYQDCLGSRDRVEALRAFAEKRSPRFTGE